MFFQTVYCSQIEWLELSSLSFNLVFAGVRRQVIQHSVCTSTWAGHTSVAQHSVEMSYACGPSMLACARSVLSRENVQQLKSMLRQNTALESLDLTSNVLGSAGLAEIAPVLYRNTSVKALELINNGLDDIDSANLLCELRIRRNRTITSLCIAHNAFGGNAAAVRSSADGVRSNLTLQKLDIGYCGLDDQGNSVLANALVARNASILELNLHSSAITSVGVRALADDNMEAVKTLSKLSLGCNRIGNEGATILANALGRNAMPSLKRLDLSFCGIGDDGFVALVAALEQNTSLQS
jgi:Ran GTPase-activating protein (RanGAP) involved in mRNA processing and transport